jgi:glucokinase
MSVLLGDIGGTNTRCALGRDDGAITGVRELRNADFASVEAVLRHYLDQIDPAEHPTRGTLAIAAPMRGDRVEMLNRAWQFSIEELRQTLGLESLQALNDFAALAWALPGLGAQDLAPVGGGVAAPHSAKVVLGPGTGLGVAALVPCHDGWQAVPGEGGHVTLAARNEREEAVIRRARQRYGHCSAERLLSGPGLGLLHAALHSGPELDAVEIGRRASAGDPAALETLESFLRFLGSVAGNLALTLGAFGGVYIGGGIVPRYLQQMRRSGFRESFEAKGRYREYLCTIPTCVITSPHPALRGLLAFDATTQPPG